MAAPQDVEAGHSKDMDPASEPPSPNTAESRAGSTEAAARIVAAVVLPVVVGGGAALFNIPIIGLLAFPVLLGAWVGCMWLALSAHHEPLSLLKQSGTSLVVAIGLLALLYTCAIVAGLAGASTRQYGVARPAELVVCHVSGVGLALLISWGQKLRANLNPTAWVGSVLYWFAYCPVSALAGALLARCGLAPGN